MRFSRVIVLCLLVLGSVLTPPAARSQSVAGSKHDLSASAVNPYSSQVCAYCHTPHLSNRVLGAPLWNRFVDRTKVYTRYQSATLDTVPGDPNDSMASVLCLGCHDGTLGTAVVNGYTGSDKHELVNPPGPSAIPANCRRCHGDIWGDPPFPALGTDLSNDHPISITYPTPAQDPAFNVPPSLSDGWPQARLFGGKVECASCHDPHNPTNVPFLRVANVGSALCLTCHVK